MDEKIRWSLDSLSTFSFLCVILEPQINLQTCMELHLGSDPLTETFYLSVLALESALSFNILSAEKKVQ